MRSVIEGELTEKQEKLSRMWEMREEEMMQGVKSCEELK